MKLKSLSRKRILRWFVLLVGLVIVGCTSKR